MKPVSIMIIAGDPSADERAAELVNALRAKLIAANASPTDAVQPLRTELAPTFFGAGGPRMKAAGVEVVFDLTQHSIIGFTRAFRQMRVFGRAFKQLFALAKARQPDVVIGVDFGGFNTRFGRAIKNYSRRHAGAFQNWRPKVVQYVSPQVWASRPGRAYRMADTHDLILSIFPFEPGWYAQRVKRLPVKFVGHPIAERARPQPTLAAGADANSPRVVILPGSRIGELRHHLEMLAGVVQLMRARFPTLQVKMVFPNDAMLQKAQTLGLPENTVAQVGGLDQALTEADIAISKSGTITVECAYFMVPTVVFYRLSWIEYQIIKRIVTVQWIAMPNLLANETVFPEFIQDEATPENIAAAALELLENKSHRQTVKDKLAKIVASLGEPGAASRAADEIVKLLK